MLCSNYRRGLCTKPRSRRIQEESSPWYTRRIGTPSPDLSVQSLRCMHLDANLDTFMTSRIHFPTMMWYGVRSDSALDGTTS